MYIYTFTYTHLHIHIYIYTFAYTHLHIHIYKYTFAYTHLHIHIHIYTFAYTHLHIRRKLDKVGGSSCGMNCIADTQLHKKVCCRQTHISMSLTSWAGHCCGMQARVGCKTRTGKVGVKNSDLRCIGTVYAYTHMCTCICAVCSRPWIHMGCEMRMECSSSRIP